MGDDGGFPNAEAFLGNETESFDKIIGDGGHVALLI